MTYILLNRDDLPRDGATSETRDFEGYLHGAAGSSFIWVDLPPGQGPRLHRHPYAEILIILEGQATFTVGAESLDAHAGQVIVVPANEPHAFVNTGPDRLRQLDIHANERFMTEWLDD
jgi:quercetin dioxygenase-like cupin family protein